jgi:hypothetical protein
MDPISASVTISALTTRFGQSHLAHAAARVAIKDQIDNYRRSKMVKGCGMCEITQSGIPQMSFMLIMTSTRWFQMLWADFKSSQDLCTYASDEGRRFKDGKVTQA